MDFPNLAGVATTELVEQIKGSGSFSASYINWSRTVQLLRTHAPGWLPELVPNKDGGWMHRAPVGAYLMIQFRHISGQVTPAVPQAIMDNKNNAIAFDSVTARDITDTHRRGICMAAALTFGLAYELWAKVPLESGYADHGKPAPEPDDESAPVSEFMAQIAEADSVALDRIASELSKSRLSTSSKEKLRAAYSIRKHGLAVAA